ncbi:hypothetical protein ACFFUT_09715 [Pseudohalocynthiibacter aestuariivivens]|jgi:hypothetical protein|uniref:Uncharacterized protein n=1 Tax=Pseudohalocynthiibacter aestuariivivens TaxID=1591409 RepID=A0ABV5JF35_9RHOB|nr:MULTISPECIES: hypothetical protein [Pseudohalocynthiibacter]MBS9717903.1 hypothetical protein [Pseudohalocynthiibacter aestuariivivens]MCK0102948.1 hypothetical protein [Pseudohalocynthiibacter sp. F2068]
MDHRTFLTTLTVEQRQSLTQKSDMKGFLHLALHWKLSGPREKEQDLRPKS